MERLLIVNADDFGQSKGINRGILRTHLEGILTSASLMVRWPSAEDAARHAGTLDLGLHIDLGEWVFRDGKWISRYERVDLNDAGAVDAEVYYQLEEFRRLTGRSPTHIDSHQHVHLHEPVLSVARQVADELSVPLRACTPIVHYCGGFYGQSETGMPCPEAISLNAFIGLLAEVPLGVTELGCHPGEDPELNSTYCGERFQEVQVLCSWRAREALHKNGIRLATFAELAQTKA